MNISIVISTHNRANLLGNTLPTLLRQPISNDKYEIIVVDDRSTDETEQVCEFFENKCDFTYIKITKREPVKVFKTFKHLLGNFNEQTPYYSNGYVQNVGIKKAKYDIIMLTDPEIYHITDTILETLQGFERHSETYKWLYFGTYGYLEHVVKPEPDPFIEPIPRDISEELLEMSNPDKEKVWKWAKEKNLRKNGGYFKYCISMHKEPIMILRGFDEDFVGWGYDDNDMMQRLFNIGVKAFNLEGDIRSPDMKDPEVVARWIHLWHPRTSQTQTHTYNRLLSQYKLGLLDDVQIRGVAEEAEGNIRNWKTDWGKVL